MTTTPTPPPTAAHRVSLARVLLLVVVVAALAAGGTYAVLSRTQDSGGATTPAPHSPTWFAGYADVTATPAYPFESPGSHSGDQVVLAFVVADRDTGAAGGCVPSWGGHYTLDQAGDERALDRRLTLLRERGDDFAVSFGGFANDELATTCTDLARLTAAYRSVIDRYDVTTLDFDVEDNDLADRTAGERRAAAIAELQKAAGADPLSVWLTLPAATAGLTSDGLATVQEFLAAGVDLAGVNAMTMNYGGSRDPGESMVDASERTLRAVHDQLSSAYADAGHPLSSADVWRHLGMTPMIGQNDVTADVLSIDDARDLSAFAHDNGLGRVSMWSLNRDTSCGTNYVTLSVVSDACSGVDQGTALFADVLADGLTAASTAPTPTPTAQPTAVDAGLRDDPRTSPYQVWRKDVTYLAGTKVVWHHNVFQAKWWTNGDLPDDPVLDTWQTPWRLLGPVMPGETPVPVPTLPIGTYPQWTMSKVYLKGDRVMVRGVPYEAKWWNRGENPRVAETNPDASPWATFDATQVRRIRDELDHG